MKTNVLFTTGVKYFITVLLSVPAFFAAHSQISYSYVTNTVAFTPNSGGTGIIPAGTDEGISAAQNIGFTFTFNCTTYTQFVASSNGWLSLGSGATQPLPGNALGTTGIGPILAPLWDNLAVDATGNVNYQLSGTAPNRVLTVEWLNMKWSAAAAGPVMSFQVKLHETTNQIEFVYRRDANGINSGSASIGLSSGNSATDFYSLDDAQSGNALYGTETNTLNKRPVGNRSYAWTEGAMAYQSSTSTQLATGLISACTPTQPVLGIQVNTRGCSSPVSITQFQINMNGTTSVTDFSKVHIYYTGTSPVYSQSGDFVSGGITPATGTITVNGSQALAEGTNYFWIAYDVSIGNPTAGNTIDAECTQLTVGGVAQTPSVTAPAGSATFTSCSVSPGGIGGMAFWIKTTNGVPTTTDGTSISSWSDQSGFVRTAGSPAAANNPTYRDNSGSNVNFNPVVEFDDAAQNAAQADYLTVPANGLLAGGNNNYSMYAVIKPGTGNTSTPGKFLFGGTAGTNSYSAFGISSSNSFADSWSSNDLVVNNAWTAGTPALASFHYDGLEREMFVAGNLAGTLPGGTRSSADVNDAIGARNDGGASEFFSGSIAEIVTYPNTLHNTSARNKIESYLGIKYGITLQHNYISSAGTTVWNLAANAAYNSNITGIGRDDNSGLSQRQGRSATGAADLLTVYIGSVKTVNQASNTGAFTAGDQSFFLVANNNAAFGYAGGGSPEKPAGIKTRLQREWLAQKTNFTNTDLHLEFDLSSTTLTGPFNPSDLRLLLDADGDFSNATIVSSPTASFSVSGAVVTVTVPASSFGSATYFTLASASAATSLPVTLSGFAAVCRNNTVQLSWTKQSTAFSSYTIERSSNGHDFTAIGSLSSLTGGEQAYTWTDNAPLPGLGYYRLAITDEAGQISYSTIAGVNSCGSYFTRMATDPVTGAATLVLQLQQSATADIRLYDVQGRLLEREGLTGTRTLQPGLYRLPVSRQGMAGGLYLVSVTINGNKETYRVVQQ